MSMTVQAVPNHGVAGLTRTQTAIVESCSDGPTSVYRLCERVRSIRGYMREQDIVRAIEALEKAGVVRVAKVS